jgi:serine/threonine-protein kinase
VKLLDFGIAKASDSSTDTRVGILKGKVAYMSPEQARGQKVDARADVFSAGVMLWEAITGRRLWNNQRDDEKLWALVAGDLPRASSVNPSIPAELDQICARAMAWNRDERYQSAGDFQRHLERYVASSGQTVSPGDLGGYVSVLFREDRVRASSLIEAYVARARAGATRDDLPVIDVSMRTPGTRSGRAMSSIGFSMPGSEDPPSGETANAAVAAPSSQSQINRRSRTPLIITVCSAVVTLVVGGVIALKSGDPPHVVEDEPAPAAVQAPAQPMTVAPSPVEAVPVQPAPSPPQAAPAPPAPAPGAIASGKKSDVVKIEIRVSPSNASLWIDDAELSGNPFGGNYRRDSDVHHVRASAPGHVTKIVAITFDSNTKLDLSLERLQPTPDRPSRPQQVRPATPQPPQNEVARTPDPQRAQAPRPAPQPEIDPAGGNKPLRNIDPNNPYGANAGRAIDPSNPYGNAP